MRLVVRRHFAPRVFSCDRNERNLILRTIKYWIYLSRHNSIGSANQSSKVHEVLCVVFELPYFDLGFVYIYTRNVSRKLQQILQISKIVSGQTRQRWHDALEYRYLITGNYQSSALVDNYIPIELILIQVPLICCYPQTILMFDMSSRVFFHDSLCSSGQNSRGT